MQCVRSRVRSPLTSQVTEGVAEDGVRGKERATSFLGWRPTREHRAVPHPLAL